MRLRCLKPAAWEVGTEELPGSLDMSYVLSLGEAGNLPWRACCSMFPEVALEGQV